MISRFPLGVLLAMLLLTGGGLAAVRFQPPSKGPAPFRRDRLPIDSDQMSRLADQLTTMAADCSRGKTAGQSRAAAQLLALAGALDPTNGGADSLLKDLKEGEVPEPPADRDLSRARSRAWQWTDWLGSSEAGADARQFASCLADALAVADARHPRAEALREKGEQGRWAGWVAPAKAFHRDDPPQPDPPQPDPPQPDPDPDPDPDPAPPPGAEGIVPLALTEATVRIPVNHYDPKREKWLFSVLPMTLRASTPEMPHNKPAPPAYQLTFLPVSKGSNPLGTSLDAIQEALRQRHGGLPANGQGTLALSGGAAYSQPRNRDAGAAAAALLMDATLGGKLPDAGVTVLGAVDKDGTLKPAWRTWDRLRQLAKQENPAGGRLILPRDCAPLLNGLLVLEQPEFFFNHEVLLANTLAELAKLAAAEPTADPAQAFESFAEVRKTSTGQVIGPFVANRFVRQRLATILKTLPDHASARMLLLQGSGDRPTEFDTAIIASELRQVLQQLKWITTARTDQLEPAALTTTFSKCREQLDPLERHVARRDEELWESAFDLVQSVRTLSNTVKRSRQATRQGLSSSTDRERPEREQLALKAALTELMTKIAFHTGEEMPAPTTPKPPRPNR